MANARFPITCLSVTRQAYLEAYPKLGNNAAYWRLFVYLLHIHSNFNYDGYLGHDLIDSFTRNPAANSAIDFLTAFKAEVLPGLKWAEAIKPSCGKPGKARTVIQTGLTKTDIDIFIVDRESMHSKGFKDRVYFENGQRWTKAKQAIINNEHTHTMQQEAAKARKQSQIEILTYHSLLSTNTYNRLMTCNEQKAKQYAKSINDSALRERLEGQIHALLHYPKPVYHVSSRDISDRIYPMPGLTNLTSCKREIRKALTHGCIELDLRAAHLAIIAADWQIDSLQTLLTELMKKNIKPWAWFADQLNVLLTPTLKEALKQGVYSLCYGSSQRNIKEAIDINSGIKGFGKQFLSLPIMRDILQARNKAVIANTNKYEQCNEDLYEMDGDVSVSGLNEHGEIRSLLSCSSQSIEQELIREVYKVANYYSEYCSILVYSFDGVTLHIRDKGMKARILEVMVREVERRAGKLGLVTTLDMEEV